MKKALLIDDDGISNFLSRRILEISHVADQFDTANNGQEALNMFNKYASGDKGYPDIVLLDLNMPVMNGFEFLKAYTALDLPCKNSITIIVVSSSTTQSDKNTVKALGAHYFIEKPLQEINLRKILQ